MTTSALPTLATLATLTADCADAAVSILARASGGVWVVTLTPSATSLESTLSTLARATGTGDTFLDALSSAWAELMELNEKAESMFRGECPVCGLAWEKHNGDECPIHYGK